jgi:hypothetical protein
MKNTIYYKWFIEGLNEQQQKEFRDMSINEQKDWYISYLENHYSVIKTKKHYTSHGLVYGNYWGGGKGAYSATRLTGETREEIIEKSKKGLEDGSLDSGMGYESLVGCLLHITEHETLEYDGKEFICRTTDMEFVGEMTEEEEDFLVECSMNM